MWKLYNRYQYNNMPEEKNIPSVSESELEVKTIPKDFYGGANPVVRFHEVERIVEVEKNKQTTVTPDEKKAWEKENASGANTKVHPANLLANKKFVIFSSFGLFAILVGVSAGYYFYQANNQDKQNQFPVPDIKQVVNSSPTSSVVVVPTPSSSVSDVIIPSSTVAIELPSRLLGVSADFDNDRISDLAEEVFNTDPANADTDGDKYPDGHEIYYLYNPAGFEPMRLIDAGIVDEYRNPIFGYKLYVPKTWAIGVVESDYREVIFSAITGENIRVRVFDLAADETFSGWFYANAPQEKMTDLLEFTTSFKLVGKMRNDGLVYYFIDRQFVYVISYHPNEDNIVNYKAVMDVVSRSFQLDTGDATTVVPEPAPGFVTPTPENLLEETPVSTDVENNVEI
jgi:hypothetical protein